MFLVELWGLYQSSKSPSLSFSFCITDTFSCRVREQTKPRPHNALWHWHSVPVMHATASLGCTGANSMFFLFFSCVYVFMCVLKVNSNSKATHQWSIRLSWTKESHNVHIVAGKLPLSAENCSAVSSYNDNISKLTSPTCLFHERPLDTSQ